jgi:hypothetical protein
MDRYLRVPLSELRHGEVQRILLLRRWVNKGKKMGRACYQPQTLS